MKRASRAQGKALRAKRTNMKNKLRSRQEDEHEPFNLMNFIFALYLGSIQGFLFGLLLFGNITISIILSLVVGLSLYELSK